MCHPGSIAGSFYRCCAAKLRRLGLDCCFWFLFAGNRPLDFGVPQIGIDTTQLCRELCIYIYIYQVALLDSDL